MITEFIGWFTAQHICDSLLGETVGGTGFHLLGKGVGTLSDQVRELFAERGKPANHHILKCLRAAEIQSAEFVVDHYVREAADGKTSSGKKVLDACNWVTKTWAQNEMDELDAHISGYSVDLAALQKHLDKLLSPELSVSEAAIVQEIRAACSKALLAELESKYGYPLPQTLHDRLALVWNEEDKEDSWFAIFTDWFKELLVRPEWNEAHQKFEIITLSTTLSTVRQIDGNARSERLLAAVEASNQQLHAKLDAVQQDVRSLMKNIAAMGTSLETVLQRLGISADVARSAQAKSYDAEALLGSICNVLAQRKMGWIMQAAINTTLDPPHFSQAFRQAWVEITGLPEYKSIISGADAIGSSHITRVRIKAGGNVRIVQGGAGSKKLDDNDIEGEGDVTIAQ
jgi:hypothetical protein